MNGWVGFFIVLIIIVCIVGALSGGKSFGEVIKEGFKTIFGIIVFIAIGIGIWIGVENKNEEKKEKAQQVRIQKERERKEINERKVTVCFINKTNKVLDGFVMWPRYPGTEERICPPEVVRLNSNQVNQYMQYNCQATKNIKGIGSAYLVHEWPGYELEPYDAGVPSASCTTFLTVTSATPGYKLNTKKGKW
jgi:hypothetical protein